MIVAVEHPAHHGRFDIDPLLLFTHSGIIPHGRKISLKPSVCLAALAVFRPEMTLPTGIFWLQKWYQNVVKGAFWSKKRFPGFRKGFLLVKNMVSEGSERAFLV